MRNLNGDMISGELAPYFFCQGTNFHSYEWLGCHSEKTSDGFEYTFRVWAPKAEKVYVTGDFNSWDESLPMKKDEKSGVWTAIYKSVRDLDGSRYKYKVVSKTRTAMKADPYAFYSETLANTASVIHTVKAKWSDSRWLSSRGKPFEGKHFYSAPMNIYEMHLGSWRTRDGESNTDGKHYLNYREIADELVPYVLDMGYTHVELMPIAEHPYDGSWGYQVCGYYAPTSRFGTPEDFIYFVNKLHKAGIGVILDWVPAHFPKDEHGLFEFDGYPLYEYQGKDRMEHKSWGTRCFDVGRPEVQSFLISNALFWMRNYHIDGLRIDAVASMLYLDYDRAPGEWIPNKDGGNHNYEAMAFFKKLNTAVFAEFPYALMIAEESTAWPMVTKPVSDGGLGFNFKWNMGWANDMFEYVSTDPFFRKYVHNKLTFPLMYAFSENYILPVSHDEVVHGKKSLLDKMFGEYDDKFACMRAFLMYMMTLPGKKLMFMGCEYAPFREWDYENQLEWFMLDYPRHAQMKDYVRTLNHFYLEHGQLWEIDDGWDGFEWIDPDRCEDNTLSYIRKSQDGEELIILLNFAPCRREGYKLRVKSKGSYSVLVNSDQARFGGSGSEIKTMKSKAHREGGKWVHEISVALPSYGALIIKKK